MNNFDAKGQLLFIDPAWVTGETCLFNISDPIDYRYASFKVQKNRQQFIKRLQNEGFIITYDRNNRDGSIINLVMNPFSIGDETMDVDKYKRIFDQRIFTAGGDKLNYPYSVSFVDYLNNPFFPAVFKNELLNAGKDKFLVENIEQVNIIKSFYELTKLYPKYKVAYDNVIFQQLIETPTEHKTYMRVLMSASGDVMGASLKYSKAKTTPLNEDSMFEPYFLNPKSSYYLNAKKMFNYYSEGGNILFSRDFFLKEEKKILNAHGINPQKTVVPEEVLEVASSIAKNCNKELGIMCGIDFILNEYDGKWYYLEIQGFPAIEEWAIGRIVHKIQNNSLDDYINYLLLDLEARHEALMLMIKRKFAEENIHKRDRIKK